jgi:hypothetical protein
MSMYRLALPGGLAALMLIGLVGCGASGEPPRETISGTVTFDGEPLQEGTIQFMPETPSTQATSAWGRVSGGKFEVLRDQGPSSGRYSVTIISGGDGAAGQPAGAMPGEGTPVKEKIPEKYNARTTLTAEVKQGGPNTYEFALKSK